MAQKMKSRPKSVQKCILHSCLFSFTTMQQKIWNPFLQRGVNDSDRNVWVSAGWVHASGLFPFWHLYLSYALLVRGLVKTLGISGAQGCNLSESNFIICLRFPQTRPEKHCLLQWGQWRNKNFLVERRNVGIIDFKLNRERWDIGSSSLSSGSTTWRTESCCEGIGGHAGGNLSFVNTNGRLSDIWRSLH